LTFDDGPAYGGSNNTQTVYSALASNPVQSNIPATFFVQTNVANRGGSDTGAAVMAMAFAAGHNVRIHTGSDGDHVLHTLRVAQPPYAGGNNALESDMIRAKARIAGLPGGSVPIYVRPPGGEYNSAVLASYAATQLTMKLWDVASGDDLVGANFSSITAQLNAQLNAAFNQGKTDIVILFHDIHSYTAQNLGTPNGYIKQISDIAQAAGRTVSFGKL
jgi:peptidoglycan/xylan/chitin deacetylase (PgdA/CDA1 family)